MADQTIFSESMTTESMEQPFLKKEVVYVQDNNSGGVYNGQIVIETSQLSNSGKWASYGEGYLYIPYVVAYKSDTDQTALLAPYLLGVKGAFWNIIHSMSVDYNGTNVAQLTPFLNLWCNYKALVSWSTNDAAKYGATTNFIKDNADSIRYRNASTTSTDATGVTNNLIAFSALPNFNAAAVPIQSSTFNTGFLARQQNIYATEAANLYGTALSNANAIIVGSHLYGNDGAAAAARVYYTSFNAVIRLKDICDFFDKLPLVKGAYIKLTINYNSSSISIANNAGSYLVSAPSITTGGSTPFMIASGIANNPGATLAGAPGNIAFASNVARVTVGSAAVANSTVSHQILNSCRLYVPIYTMNPIYEEQYLSMNPTKDVVYRDIYQYTINAAGTGGTQQNVLLSNGIVSPKQLVMVPFYNGSSGGATQFSNLASINALSSPLTGAHPDPFAAVSNLNVQLSGTNMFQQNISYGWEEFSNEVSRSYSVNAGLTTGLTSGLLNQHEWERLYRYVVCDLSRGYKADDFIPKSVLVTFQNASSFVLDVYCFIEYERKISISVASGQIVQV